MDDTYVISNDKNKLKNVLADCSAMWDALGIKLNLRKTQILPIKRFSFMHVRFRITATGKVLMLPNKKSFTRMRRKLRAFANLFRSGQMTFTQINTCYQSWYGYQSHFDAYKSLRNMDKFFHDLFGVWPKHKKGGAQQYDKCFVGQPQLYLERVPG